MKYDEIPIDDSKGIEQFKIGDKVEVYSTKNKDVFDIKHIRGPHITQGEGYVWYHWKQCRLLKEKKPRTFLLRPVEDQPYCEFVEFDGTPNQKRGWIKVREVLEDE
jgi:hypothetical protein